MNRHISLSVDNLPKHVLQRMRSIASSAHATLHTLPESDGWASFPLESEVVFGLPPIGWVERSALRFLQLHSAGFDSYTALSLSHRSDFRVANARGVTAQAVAEHCLSMIFALTRRTKQHVQQQRERQWQRAPQYDLLHGTTIAIVGTGAIGSALGVMCRGIGMRVVAVQRRSELPPWADAAVPFHDLRDALASCHHLALALPSLPGLPVIGRAELSCLPRGSYVWNVGRASALDYTALTDALQTGWLAGAGLDVFPTEPLPPSDPLWSLPNVLVSPHAGGRFRGEMDALGELFVDNLQRYLQGLPLRNIVVSRDASI